MPKGKKNNNYHVDSDYDSSSDDDGYYSEDYRDMRGRARTK